MIRFWCILYQQKNIADTDYDIYILHNQLDR